MAEQDQDRVRNLVSRAAKLICDDDPNVRIAGITLVFALPKEALPTLIKAIEHYSATGTETTPTTTE